MPDRINLNEPTNAECGGALTELHESTLLFKIWDGRRSQIEAPPRPPLLKSSVNYAMARDPFPVEITSDGRIICSERLQPFDASKTFLETTSQRNLSDTGDAFLRVEAADSLSSELVSGSLRTVRTVGLTLLAAYAVDRIAAKIFGGDQQNFGSTSLVAGSYLLGRGFNLVAGSHDSSTSKHSLGSLVADDAALKAKAMNSR
jgi:hypothetical protein